MRAKNQRKPLLFKARDVELEKSQPTETSVAAASAHELSGEIASIQKRLLLSQYLYLSSLLIAVILAILYATLLYPSLPKLLLAAIVNIMLWPGILLHRQATSQLTRIDNLHAIGPLLESYGFVDRASRSLTEKMLIRLLPRLQASDASLLSPSQRDTLHTILHSKNRDLVLVAIQAIEQAGNTSAIPHIEPLAKGRGKAAQDSEVRRTAQWCLTALQARAAGRQDTETLLRPSDITASPDGSLLRPVESSADKDPQQLLRPGPTEQR